MNREKGTLQDNLLALISILGGENLISLLLKILHFGYTL